MRCGNNELILQLRSTLTHTHTHKQRTILAGNAETLRREISFAEKRGLQPTGLADAAASDTRIKHRVANRIIFSFVRHIDAVAASFAEKKPSCHFKNRVSSVSRPLVRLISVIIRASERFGLRFRTAADNENPLCEYRGEPTVDSHSYERISYVRSLPLSRRSQRHVLPIYATRSARNRNLGVASASLASEQEETRRISARDTRRKIHKASSSSDV